MTFLLKQLFALIRLLNSDTGTNQIASGVACGLILGFAPALSIQTFIIIFLLFFFRIQIGATTISAFFFSFIAWILDPIHNLIGIKILESESLHPLFTHLYNIPILPLTRFYNSIVMGSFAVSLVLAVPVFFLSQILIQKYRTKVLAQIQKTNVWKTLQATSLYNWYLKYKQIY
jgi:uncharacterized protein (TIGR03546 family)